MAERPILFSLPMVQAILAGNKTQTRRVFKQLECRSCKNIGEIHKLLKDGSMSIRPCPKCHGETKCAYKVGDRLWVRETFSQVVNLGVDKNGNIASELFSYNYKADLTAPIGGYWKPSIFMPRSASRILLEITNIRVERLHDISEQDALAEGIENKTVDNNVYFKDYVSGNFFKRRFDDGTEKQSYFSLWQSINGHESLKANPWVWVITFKVVEIKQ